MSTYDATQVQCPACAHEQTAILVESANVQRLPEYRAQVLAGTFMTFTCEGCGEVTVVERDILYTDLEHDVFVLVFPRERRPEAVALSAMAEEVFRAAVLEEAPPVVTQRYGRVEPRIVFGYDELREKVLCHDHGLDDRAVEAVKHALLSVGGSEEAGVRGLLLAAVDPEEEGGALYFAQVGSGFDPESRPLLMVERQVYGDMTVGGGPALLARPELLGGPYVHRERLVAADL